MRVIAVLAVILLLSVLGYEFIRTSVETGVVYKCKTCGVVISRETKTMSVPLKDANQYAIREDHSRYCEKCGNEIVTCTVTHKCDICGKVLETTTFTGSQKDELCNKVVRDRRCSVCEVRNNVEKGAEVVGDWMGGVGRALGEGVVKGASRDTKE